MKFGRRVVEGRFDVVTTTVAKKDGDNLGFSQSSQQVRRTRVLTKEFLVNTQIQHSLVKVWVNGPVGIIELAQPEKFNCLSTETFLLIDVALRNFEHESSGVRSILIRSQGTNFCTGADLNEVKAARKSPERLHHFLRTGHDVLCNLEASPLPVVIACQGLCLAGGLELALAGDIVFADVAARFGDQHAAYGFVPGWGGSQRLSRVVGLRRAMDLMLAARWIDSAKALDWGLVNYVCEPGTLHDAALSYCRTLATRSRTGMGTMKHLARRGADQALLNGLRLEEDIASGLVLGQDVEEGLKAFEQRRKPSFKS